MSTCKYWIGNDETGRRCTDPAEFARVFCEKHGKVMARRVRKDRERAEAKNARADERDRARLVPKLPEMRERLAKAEAELERRTTPAVQDRAAIAGNVHKSIVAKRARLLTDTNIERVNALFAEVRKLRRDIARAEQLEASA